MSSVTIDPLEPRRLNAAVDFSQFVSPAEVRALLTDDVARFDGGLLRDAKGNLAKDAAGKARPDTAARSATASNAKGGMGAFVTGFDGFFRISQLDRQFNNKANPWTDTWAGSSISQSRAVFINATAARWETDAALSAKFKTAATKGADFLARPLDPANKSYGFADPASGGYLWEVAPAGTASKPDYSAYKLWDGSKDAYGQTHPVFALVAAYEAGGGMAYLDKAATSWAAYLARYRDPNYVGPYAAGALLPTQSQDFSAVTGTRNLNDSCHAFEAGIALYDALPAADARRVTVRDDVNALGDFITHVMSRDEAGSGGARAYLPWKYADSAWTPIDSAGASIGHQVEYAFLLSRAVEAGLGDASWLTTADKLMAFSFKYGLATKGDKNQYAFLDQDTVNFDGSDAASEPGENIGWWQQIELLRATANALVVRGRTDLDDVFTKAWVGFRDKFVDAAYGGTFDWIDPTTLRGPWATAGSTWQDNAKGWEWKVDYHESMMYDELLRLVDQTRPPTPPPTVGTASLAGTAFKDNNANGKYDTGDGIGSGVVVFLDNDNDGVLDATETRVTTDGRGKFSFTKLAAGTYHVRRVLASGTAYSTAKLDVTLTNGQSKTGLLVGSKRA